MHERRRPRPLCPPRSRRLRRARSLAPRVSSMESARQACSRRWNLVRPLLEGSLVVSLKEIASAIRLLVERNRVVAEGAGGSAVAAALAGKAGKGRIVCVVSGGNIDTGVLGKILRGEVP